MVHYNFEKNVMIIFSNDSNNIVELTQAIEDVRPSSHVLIWQPWEASDNIFYEYQKQDYTKNPNHSDDINNFENTLVKYNINCFLLVGCDYSDAYLNLKKNPIKNFDVLFWPTSLLHYTYYGMTQFYGKNPLELFNPQKSINKLYLNLNNHERNHRAQFMDYLCKFGLFDYGINTWAQEVENWPYKYFKARKLTFEENRDPSRPHKVYSPELLNVNNLIDIVTETSPCLDRKNVLSREQCFIFHTEKTFRSILFGKPFLVLGNKGQNKNLTKYGITLYESIFDYDFDSEESMKSRCFGIIDNLFGIKNKNYNEVRDSVIGVSKSNIDILMNIVYNDKYIPEKLKSLIRENREECRSLFRVIDYTYSETFGINKNWRLTDNIFKNIY